MKVVFLKEVEGSGLVGEVKEVKNGYARNYLLPRELVAPATKAAIERATKLAKVDAVRQEKADAAARLLADRIDGATVELAAKVGEQGRLFGSVTAADIAGQLSERVGAKIEHRQVLLGQAIKAIGTQGVRVRFTRNVFANVTVEVASEEGESADPPPATEQEVPAEETEDESAEAATPDVEPQTESD